VKRGSIMHGDEGVLRCLQARELLQRPSPVRRPASLTPTPILAVPLSFCFPALFPSTTTELPLTCSLRDLQARRKLLFTEPLARTLGLEATLRGHRGCVNRLAWSQDGTLLASGSDDRQVCPQHVVTAVFMALNTCRMPLTCLLAHLRHAVFSILLCMTICMAASLLYDARFSAVRRPSLLLSVGVRPGRNA